MGIALAEQPPLSLYVHIPWCLRKCPYCDFNSHERRGDLPEGQYIDALVADVEAAYPNVYGRRVQTIFIGGGTPSLFAPASIERLLTALRTRLPVEPEAEITLEANPGTFEVERFRGYLREAGKDADAFPIEGRVSIARIHGGPDEWVKMARGFRDDLRCTHLEINTMGAGYASLGEHVKALERFATDAKDLFG